VRTSSESIVRSIAGVDPEFRLASKQLGLHVVAPRRHVLNNTQHRALLLVTHFLSSFDGLAPPNPSQDNRTMKRLVSDCCLKLGLIPGHELEKTLKITLDQFMLSEKRRGLRDAQVDQTSADHKVAVQQFLDEYGDRFWPQAQAECGGLLHYAPVFPRDQQV